MKPIHASAIALLFAGALVPAAAQETRGGLGALGGMFSAFTGRGPAASESIEVRTGRTRATKAYINLEGTAVELAGDATVAGDFSKPNSYAGVRSNPVVQYVTYIRAGETLTARAVSTDGYLLIRFGSGPGDWSHGTSEVPSMNGPKQALLSYTTKKDRLVYITVSGMLPKTGGGFYMNRTAPVGRFTLQLGDPGQPFRTPTPVLDLAESGQAGATANAGGGDSLEATYARMCAGGAPENETCTALRTAMIAKLSAPPAATKPPPAAAAPPPGRRVNPGPAPFAGNRPAAEATLAAVPQREPVDPVRWAAAETAIAMRPTPFTQALETQFGRNGKLDLKLPAGQGVEVQLDMTGGAGTAYFCLKGSHCLQQAVTDAVQTFRFRPASSATLELRVLGSSGPASKYYRIRTRGDTDGEGIHLLTRFERLAGPPQIMELQDKRGLPVKVAMDYIVKEPSRSGSLRYREESGETSNLELAVDPAGNLAFSHLGNNGTVQPGLDGGLNLHYATGRIAYYIDRDGNVRRTDAARIAVNVGNKPLPADQGMFLAPASDAMAKPVTERAVVAMLAAGPRRIEAALAARLQDWGPLVKMAGKSFVVQDASGQTISEYAWEIEGYRLAIKRWGANGYGVQQPASVSRYTHDPATGQLKVENFAGGQSSTAVASINRTGALEVRGAAGVQVLALSGNGDVMRTASADGAPVRMGPLSPGELTNLSSRNRQIEQERQQQLAAAEAQRKEGGGFFGFLNQAVNAYQTATNPDAYRAAMIGQLNQAVPGLGDAAAIAGGGNTDAYRSAMIGQLNQAVPGLGDAAAIAAGGQPATMAGIGGQAGGGGPGQTQPGSYPTKGPHRDAVNACAGFNENNYQQRALADGPDKQLRTLCGLAWDHYNSYKNAIRKGYSQADAEITYKAHERAALVAIDFLQSAQ